ncbi:MAG: hypothetical protein K2W92_01010 [Alphaproteobacteria bacterium]|nr:hypothetical protein [Alphaproteobacteria bacterium]
MACIQHVDFESTGVIETWAKKGNSQSPEELLQQDYDSIHQQMYVLLDRLSRL